MRDKRIAAAILRIGRIDGRACSGGDRRRADVPRAFGGAESAYKRGRAVPSDWDSGTGQPISGLDNRTVIPGVVALSH